jgi:hypothetical protein
MVIEDWKVFLYLYFIFALKVIDPLYDNLRSLALICMHLRSAINVGLIIAGMTSIFVIVSFDRPCELICTLLYAFLFFEEFSC